MAIMPMSVIGSPGIDISATCFRPPACAGLAEIMAASAATTTDVERDFIGTTVAERIPSLAQYCFIAQAGRLDQLSHRRREAPWTPAEFLEIERAKKTQIF